MDKREVLEKLLRDVIGDNEATDKWLNSIYGVPLDQALTALDKLEKEKRNGAYKSGYHDALNGRPYKVSDLQRGLE